MKKAICVILALASAFTLTGCTSVYSNFKEIEQLLVIQALQRRLIFEPCALDDHFSEA